MHTIREVGLDRRVCAHCDSGSLGRSVIIAPTRKMESSSSRNNVCIIGRRRVRDDSGAASVQMAQFVGQVLQCVRGEIVLVEQNVVVRGTGGAHDTGMTLKIKIKLEGMDNPFVNHSSRLAVSCPVAVTGMNREEASVMAFLNDDNGDLGVVSLLH